ncbi:WAS/WASL-interacting protein family member 2-like [Panicum virgatum]|uniref:WAS/WASL-interacting protein family member 2-like n=1 Tax=Panicum virgatum TaxID=38727 RepID=UPI0019D68D33|nr:WAS/WASL-interacting protein family member 2-like [Panicum virgatum]
MGWYQIWRGARSLSVVAVLDGDPWWPCRSRVVHPAQPRPSTRMWGGREAQQQPAAAPPAKQVVHRRPCPGEAPDSASLGAAVEVEDVDAARALDGAGSDVVHTGPWRPSRGLTAADATREARLASSVAAVLGRRAVPDGDTALQLAVRLQLPSMASVLAAAGADPTLQNHAGWTPRSRRRSASGVETNAGGRGRPPGSLLVLHRHIRRVRLPAGPTSSSSNTDTSLLRRGTPPPPSLAILGAVDHVVIGPESLDASIPPSRRTRRIERGCLATATTSRPPLACCCGCGCAALCYYPTFISAPPSSTASDHLLLSSLAPAQPPPQPQPPGPAGAGTPPPPPPPATHHAMNPYPYPYPYQHQYQYQYQQHEDKTHLNPPSGAAAA